MQGKCALVRVPESSPNIPTQRVSICVLVSDDDTFGMRCAICDVSIKWTPPCINIIRDVGLDGKRGRQGKIGKIVKGRWGLRRECVQFRRIDMREWWRSQGDRSRFGVTENWNRWVDGIQRDGIQRENNEQKKSEFMRRERTIYFAYYTITVLHNFCGKEVEGLLGSIRNNLTGVGRVNLNQIQRLAMTYRLL